MGAGSAFRHSQLLGAESNCPPIVVFTKVYQPLKLSFEESAELTREAGLSGIDAVIRPEGEIEPGVAVVKLPAYIAELKARRLSMPFITTAVVSRESPAVEPMLETAAQCGVKFYRLGFINRKEGGQQIRET